MSSSRLAVRRGIWGVGVVLVAAGLGALIFWRVQAYQGSEAYWRASAEKNPKSAAAQLGLADYLYEASLKAADGAGRKAGAEEAAKYYQHAAGIDGSPRTFEKWGHIYYQLGDFAQAVDIYSQGLLQHPDDADLLISDGVALFALKRNKEAIFVLGPGLDKKPDSVLGQTAMEQALRNEGRPGEAFEHAEKLLDMERGEPSEWRALNEMGETLLAIDRFPDAVERFREALKLAPGDLETMNHLGRALHMANQLPEAMEVFDAALKRDPNLALTHFNRGAALAAMGKFKEGLAELHKAVELKPDYADGWAALAEIYSQPTEFKNLPEAIEYASKACTLTNDEDLVDLFLLENAYTKSGKWKEAIEAGERGLMRAQSVGDEEKAKEIAARIVEYRSVGGG